VRNNIIKLIWSTTHVNTHVALPLPPVVLPSGGCKSIDEAVHILKHGKNLLPVVSVLQDASDELCCLVV
jgi:hypothetical protein